MKKAIIVPLIKSFLQEIEMAGILDSVNQRTQLVGQNRLELLLFKLWDYWLEFHSTILQDQCPNKNLGALQRRKAG